MSIQNAADIDNTFIGKGIVKIKVTGESTFRDVGEVPEFEFSMSVTRLPYFSNRSGVRTKVRDVITEKSASLRIVMSELTFDNLSMALLGYNLEDSPTVDVIGIMTESEITAAVRFVGQNTIGAKIQIDLPSVSFSPSGSFSPISDEWGQLEISGEVLADDSGSFGTARWNISAEVP